VTGSCNDVPVRLAA